MGAEGVPKGTAWATRPTAAKRWSLPLHPLVATETAPPGNRGQKQDFRRGCQQFPDPEGNADRDRHWGGGGEQGAPRGAHPC